MERLRMNQFAQKTISGGKTFFMSQC